MRPDICTSTICRAFDSPYCIECSHGVYFGEGIDKNGKLWRWRFQAYYGPMFLKTDGDPLKNQPERENHPAWGPFEAWQEKHNKKRFKRRAKNEKIPIR
ncbi:MAG: hypothetical protein Q7J67_00245 [bacterium]|nr:hypothetical protein [bacterium]